MTTRFTISPNVCSSSDKDGSTILNVEKGVLYSVIGVGSLIWTKLTARPDGLSVEDLVSSIQADFKGVSERQIREDAEKLLNQLSQKGIVETSNGKILRIGGTGQRWFDTAVELLARMTVTSILNLRLISFGAFLELAVIDLTLKVGGFRALHRLVKRWPLANRKGPEPTPLQYVCAAVDRAATYYPKQTLCLHRSAVTTCFLRSHGVPAQMVIACRKVPFKGHAWVEVGADVVNDNQKVKVLYCNVLERC